MDFSVIIPVYNRPEEIGRCVRSVYACDYPPTQYEVLVVDNGSTDETALRAQMAGARVLMLEAPNRCEARNAGARVARGEWLVFTDSDCEAERGWLRELAAAREKVEPEMRRGGVEDDGPDGDEGAESGGVAGARTADGGRDERAARSPAILAGRIEPAEATTPEEDYIARRGWIDQEKFLRDEPFSPPFGATANLAIERRLFEEVGGFDPMLKIAGEDADLCWRAAARGAATEYVEGAVVRHFHRATREGLVRQAYAYGWGNAALFAKYRREWQAERWIDARPWVWAAKGLVKAPVQRLTGGGEPAGREAWFDFLSNAALAAGRWRGGRAHGVRVI